MNINKINKEAIIIPAVGVTFLIGFGLLLYFFTPSSVSPSISIDENLLTKETSHMTGQKEASVTVVEFGDYQCPACGQTYPLTEELIKIYGQNSDFNFVYRHFPLPQHKNAQIAAEAAEAAGAQGKFWEMHKLLYENQDEWSEDSNPLPIFEKYAEALRLDTQEFIDALNGHTYADIVKSDASDGKKIPLDHTPTLFINGIEEKNISLYNLKEKINSLLNI